MTLLRIVLLLTLTACTGTETTVAEVSEDFAEAETPSCELEPIPADFEYPAGPYGIEVGDRLEDFVLADCDGEPVSFGQLLSQSELVLLNVGAGWCAPCIEETRTLDAEVHRAFCGRGLRVVQVLFEDANARPTTSLSCRTWRDRYSLSFPVLKDPLFTTEVHFDDHLAQTPLNLLVNRDGVIVYRVTGSAPDDLIETIDELLPP